MGALAALLAGCPCDPGVPEVFHEGFENWCGDMPCGWTLVAGSAEIASTYHAGEHGVALEAGSRMSYNLADLPLSPEPEAVDAILVLARCDVPCEVVLTVVTDAGDLVATMDPGFSPAADLFETRRLDLAPEGAGAGRHATRLAIEVTAGSCTIDELWILSGMMRQCQG
jgi:hypothetical protein